MSKMTRIMRLVVGVALLCAWPSLASAQGLPDGHQLGLSGAPGELKSEFMEREAAEQVARRDELWEGVAPLAVGAGGVFVGYVLGSFALANAGEPMWLEDQEPFWPGLFNGTQYGRAGGGELFLSVLIMGGAGAVFLGTSGYRLTANEGLEFDRALWQTVGGVVGAGVGMVAARPLADAVWDADPNAPVLWIPVTMVAGGMIAGIFAGDAVAGALSDEGDVQLTLTPNLEGGMSAAVMGRF